MRKNHAHKFSRRWFRYFWIILIGAFLIGGWAQLRMETNIFSLLPSSIPEARGLRWFQESFSDSGQVLVVLDGKEQGLSELEVENWTSSLGEFLREENELVESVIWMAPWDEDPAQLTELIAYLWLNQSPEVFQTLADRLDPNLAAERFQNAREELTYSFSPADIGRLSYDPLQVTELPDTGILTADSVSGSGSGSGSSDSMQGLMSPGNGKAGFVSEDGLLRIIYLQPAGEAKDYKSATRWWRELRLRIADWEAQYARAGLSGGIPEITFTGGPIFSAEIGTAMEGDMTFSVGGALLITLVLFKLAHGGWRPLVWIVACMGMILAVTLSVGGWIWGSMNVVSVGFAAILLGIGVDYALTLYQEAKHQVRISEAGTVQPSMIRSMVGPGIGWSALTTALGFFSLSLSHFPGLSQLGGMVATGILVAAVVMTFVFLPLTFPKKSKSEVASNFVDQGKEEGMGTSSSEANTLAPSGWDSRVGWVGALLVAMCWGGLALCGGPEFDGSQAALQQTESVAQSAAEKIQSRMNTTGTSQWLIVRGREAADVAKALQVVDQELRSVVKDREVESAFTPSVWYPNLANQRANLKQAQTLMDGKGVIEKAAKEAGFTERATGLIDRIFSAWKSSRESIRKNAAYIPENAGASWILDRLRSTAGEHQMALGWIRSSNDKTAEGNVDPVNKHGWDPEVLRRIRNQINQAIRKAGLDDRVQFELAGWDALAPALLGALKSDFWKIVIPVCALTLPALWLAFREWKTCLLSLGCLASGAGLLLAFMRWLHWEWNLMNVMACPLLIGLGVDYSIHIQKSLKRNRGDLRSMWNGVGKALCLCALTTVAGFGSLSFSQNAGMASLGRACALGVLAIALVSIGFCPFWWRQWVGVSEKDSTRAPSRFYGPEVWLMALKISRWIPVALLYPFARFVFRTYGSLNQKRLQIVESNLSLIEKDPVLRREMALKLFEAFSVKLVDLWRFEGGASVQEQFSRWVGWEHMESALKTKRGIVLVTLHLGNWEIGAPLLTERGVKLNVVTSKEPGEGFTEMRENLRSQRGVKTWVVGEDPFATVPLIQRLQEGEAVAALLDRPMAGDGVEVPFMGSTIQASRGVAELVRASGSMILPVAILREKEGYCAHILPEVEYDRKALRSHDGRIALTAEMMKRFEPLVQSHPEQWFHFIPVIP